MFYQVWFSEKVKRCAIITHKHSICEGPHGLHNGLRLRILGNQKRSGVCLSLKNDRLVPSLPANMKILVGTSKKVSPAVFHMKTKVSLKYFLNVCLWKLFAASLLPQIPLNLILLTILRTPRPLTHFNPKIRAIKSQKHADICHTW